MLFVTWVAMISRRRRWGTSCWYGGGLHPDGVSLGVNHLFEQLRPFFRRRHLLPPQAEENAVAWKRQRLCNAHGPKRLERRVGAGADGAELDARVIATAADHRDPPRARHRVDWQ